jgi:hypothetical protein
LGPFTLDSEIPVAIAKLNLSNRPARGVDPC